MRIKQDNDILSCFTYGDTHYTCACCSRDYDDENMIKPSSVLHPDEIIRRLAAEGYEATERDTFLKAISYGFVGNIDMDYGAELVDGEWNEINMPYGDKGSTIVIYDTQVFVAEVKHGKVVHVEESGYNELFWIYTEIVKRSLDKANGM